MLDLGPDTSCDVISQLISSALKAINGLLELANHRVPHLLLSLFAVLHVGLKLVDVWKQLDRKGKWFSLSHNKATLKIQYFEFVFSLPLSPNISINFMHQTSCVKSFLLWQISVNVGYCVGW